MQRTPCTMDIECYRNYFLIRFRDELTHEFHDFPMYDGCPLDIPRLVDLLARVTMYTFNGNNYDLPILTLALYGANNSMLKDAGDAIIQGGLRSWQFYDKYQIQVPPYIDHVDVMEVAAGVRIGLKMYAGRIHAKKMQDLPIEPSALITPVDRFNLFVYCGNDLDVTGGLVKGLESRLELREALSTKYGIDLRSKSDAQIAEAVIKAQLPFKPIKRYIPHGFTFKYEAPDYIRFVSPHLRALLETIHAAAFVVSDKEEALLMGHEEQGLRTGVQIPSVLKGLDIHIGNAAYRLGIGGIHSQESSVSYYSDDNYIIKDIDVKSYYPSLILNMNMFPEQLGAEFLTIYRRVYETRLAAKADAERMESMGNAMGGKEGAEIVQAGKVKKTEADGLKITLNGTFGKLFSKYSILYAPELGIKTTLSGQLSLLMLIEMLELCGVQVISANTDGIVLRIPRALEQLVNDTVKWWEKATGLEMEESRYKSIHSRDVNNYIAITDKGKVKRKGVFAPAGLLENKHPSKTICAEAVVAYLKDGTPIERTIVECDDIRQFIVVRNVSGGGEYVWNIQSEWIESADGRREPKRTYLGKAVRWYHSTLSVAGHIEYKNNGNLVAGSTKCRAAMELPETLPNDIDYAHYIRVAMEMLADIGIPVRYWHHPESECVFITLSDGVGADQSCNEIDRKTYDKRKK